MAVTIGKLLKIGTSGPIDADGNGPQRARQASSIGFGREGAICEYNEIMQILPGSSDNALLINASGAFCNMPAPRSCKKTLASVSLHGRHQPFPELQAQQPQTQQRLERGRRNR
jgi:hypothetical protein